MTTNQKDKIIKLDHDYHNYYGMNIDKAIKMIEGDLTYLGTFCLFGNYKPCVVFANANPNLEKGHKPYCYLVQHGGEFNSGDGGWSIGGMDEEKFEKERYQTGTYCNHCETLIYSTMRHDYRPCKCKESKKQIHVDGGKDYFKFSWGKEASFQHVKIDFKTGQLTPTEDTRNKGDIAVDKKIDEMIEEEDKT